MGVNNHYLKYRLIPVVALSLIFLVLQSISADVAPANAGGIGYPQWNSNYSDFLLQTLRFE